MPIKIDLVAELQTALTDPDVRSVLTAYLKQAVKEALAERDTDTDIMNFARWESWPGFSGSSSSTRRSSGSDRS